MLFVYFGSNSIVEESNRDCELIQTDFADERIMCKRICSKIRQIFVTNGLPVPICFLMSVSVLFDALAMDTEWSRQTNKINDK